MTDLWAALALVAVLEGLVLFAFPGLWRRTAEQLLSTPIAQVRLIGGIVMAAGLVALYFIRN
ncbi:MAG TPA: DUF2065 family protein [Xanthomonadaceae bacterium]|jgi:uncharacterized protein